MIASMQNKFDVFTLYLVIYRNIIIIINMIVLFIYKYYKYNLVI